MAGAPVQVTNGPCCGPSGILCGDHILPRPVTCPVHQESSPNVGTGVGDHRPLDRSNSPSFAAQTLSCPCTMRDRITILQDAMVKVESTVQQLQERLGEMALMIQTLQATSYSGTFIWKIPEVRRRRKEAVVGKTISLCSAPFYTSRHGYKLCLRVYMDGDGSGKGTHLSFFLTIMRGEYDALLPWPFRQTVTLMLLDQDKQQDIIQSFRPEPTSSSFQRPYSDMNIASGCPTFAPLSVLKNSSYVKDDTMFVKCIVDTSRTEVN